MSNLEGELNRNPERLFQTVLKDPNKYSSSFVFDVRLKHIKSGPVTLFEQKEDSGVSDELATSLEQLPVHPLILGWLISAVIRLCVGSATVAALTAASVVMPLVTQTGANPNLMA